MTPPVPDPSRTSDEFAARLTEAIKARGLTLQRIKDHLAVQGFHVSVASLSYWSAGRSRPTRASSMGVVKALEGELRLPPGHLTDALEGVESLGLGDALGRGEALRAAIDEHKVKVDRVRDTQLVQHRVWIGADGAEKASEVSELTRGTNRPIDGWSLALGRVIAPITCTETVGCEVTRQIDVLADLKLFEFSLSRPLQAGEVVFTSYRMEFPSNGDPTTESGIGFARSMPRAHMQVFFDGDMPTSFHRVFAPAVGDEVVVDQPVYASGNCAQMTIDDAAPGMHKLCWTW